VSGHTDKHTDRNDCFIWTTKVIGKSRESIAVPRKGLTVCRWSTDQCGCGCFRQPQEPRSRQAKQSCRAPCWRCSAHARCWRSAHLRPPCRHRRSSQPVNHATWVTTEFCNPLTARGFYYLEKNRINLLMSHLASVMGVQQSDS